MEYKVGDVFIVKKYDDFEYYSNGLNYENFYRNGIKKIEIFKIRVVGPERKDFESEYREAIKDLRDKCLDNIKGADHIKSIVDQIIEKKEFDLEEFPISFNLLYSFPIYSNEDLENEILDVRDLIREHEDKTHYIIRTNKKSSKRTGVLYESELKHLIRSGIIVIDPECLARQISGAIKAVSKNEEVPLNER